MAINPPVDATKTPEWAALQKHYDELQSEGISLKQWFADDAERVEKLSFDAGDLHFDLSKNLIKPETLQLFADLAKAVKLDERTKAMYTGVHINNTEDRAVLHTALRRPAEDEGKYIVDGQDTVKDVREVIESARKQRFFDAKPPFLFIDEIHRFNKSQQDALLPHVEDGTLILIGATTENPYFEVNKALVSRSIVFELRQLEDKDIKRLLERALTDEKNGMGIYHARMDADAMDFLANTANGDARPALNALELAVLTTEPQADKTIHITLEEAQECIQKRALNYDKDGDNHYDTISAFIKSMRGSNPDAALYYLAKMIYAGEDPKFIARRVVICASEDVGNADPHALQVAVSAMQAVNFIGMPEGRIPLAQAVTYVACAPKSNAAYLGIDKALSDVRNIRIRPVPPHLKDSHYSGAKELEHGVGYKYAHDYPGHYVKQQYLPDELVGTVYYAMTENGVERRMKEHLRRLKGE